jgi:Protein of unknown function (DUF2510)
MGGGARVPDPTFDGSLTGIVRWEPPETPSEEQGVALPAFVPGQIREEVVAAPAQDAGNERFEPGADPDWKFEPVGEPPPAAPKGQWWAAWLPDPRQRHEFRYWDGNNWTDHVSDAGLAGIDPL